MSNLALEPMPRQWPDPGAAYRRGVVLVLLTATFWSFSGLIVRGIEVAGPWEVLFYRSLGVTLGAGLIVLWRHGGRAPRVLGAIGWPGLLAAFCLATASVSFFHALFQTTVANVSFIFAAHPFYAALLAWLVLRERVARRTWVAAGLALVGVLLMVVEGLAVGGLSGNLLALLASMLSAGYAVALRCGRRRDMTPAVALSGAFALLASAPMVSEFAVPWQDIALCLLQGMVISAFCNSVFAFAARAVPAAELTLLTLLETVLAPTWVFLVIAERPSPTTLIGGTVILAAVMGHALWSLKSAAPSRAFGRPPG
ncbi:MAG: DMT family transporter [Pseudomonadota bacterium]